MIKALVCAYLSLTLAHCLFTIECFTSLFTITLLYTKQYVSISFFLKKENMSITVSQLTKEQQNK